MAKERLDETLEDLAGVLKSARELVVALREAGVTKFEIADEKTGVYFGYPRPHPFDPVAKTEENQPIPDSELSNINPAQAHP